ncbi:hypothetical protein LNO81_26575 [Klebsiella variicola subsp. variicola]|nr:hypothetical protein [Klebsiella variicola subsp. variicola]
MGAATRYLLLKRGVVGNTKISRIEDSVLRGEAVVKVESAERHHAMVNFWRTSVSSCILGTLFWLWTGWTLRQRRDGDDCRRYRAGDAPA